MNDVATYGVHSEVGRLRKVLVCAPGLAHRRLTPTNTDDLLFDDVMWVENAQRDHADFVNKMRSAASRSSSCTTCSPETMAIPGAKRDWLLDRKIVPNEVGLGLVDDTRAFLESLDAAAAGGVPDRRAAPPTTSPRTSGAEYVALARESTGAREYLMPPLPNTLYTRDTTCWLYGGLTMNPLYWPARHDETLLYKAIYEFHPDFVGSTVWWGDPERDWGQATFEGGDIMPVGNGVVLMGMSERTSRQAITPGRRRAVRRTAPPSGSSSPACRRLRAAMHLDTVFTFADRDIVTLYPTIMDAVHTFSLRAERPAAGARGDRRGQHAFVDVVAESLGLTELRVIETGGDVYAVGAAAVGQRQQRRRARAGRRLHLRPQHAHQHPAAQGRGRGDHDRGRRARARTRRRPLHDLSDHPRRRRVLMKVLRGVGVAGAAVVVVLALAGCGSDDGDGRRCRCPTTSTARRTRRPT